MTRNYPRALAQARAALMQEMNAAALLGEHQNVVRLVGVCEVQEEGKLLVVLERADGRCARRALALAAVTV
jgi:hypothetical protein